MMSKIKIECTEDQRSQIINMVVKSKLSCKDCVLFKNCENAEWYERCVDMWEKEIDWKILKRRIK